MSDAPLFMGVDGGGSGLRVVVVDGALRVVTQASGPAANPSANGRQAAEEIIIGAIHAALAQLPGVGQIVAVGLGVAGAAASHARDWLLALASRALPGAAVAPSADYEIALVGAHGRRQGLLVLAGTGALAYGVNAQGESALAGGWGYLLGDEGGGYWLGMQALRAACRDSDEGHSPSALARAVLEVLGLAEARTLVPWLYRQTPTPVAQVAALAPLVLAQAEAGDGAATGIVAQAARALASLADDVRRRLRLSAEEPLALAGGLLSAPNPLSSALVAALGLASWPRPQYTPAIGAAILAREAWEQQHG